MGIPRFFGWLKRQDYTGVMQSSVPASVNVMIFDMNSLFHQALQMTYAYGDHFNFRRAKYVRQASLEELESDFYTTLITLLVNAAAKVQPQDIVLLAVDGVAPIAKIQQQRQRRYRGPRTSQDDNDRDTEEVKELRKPIVDPNMITPGTEFMFRLDVFLRKWLNDKQNSVLLFAEKVIYSSHLVPGEGEHKYLDLLRSGEIPSSGTHVIHGMDADLFILSLISPADDIYITRDDISEVVSIADLRHALTRMMQQETTTHDFALLTFLLGNDFFPHQPSLLSMDNGIDALITAYTQVNRPLTHYFNGRHEIIWDNFREFLRALSQYESTLLSEEAIRGFTYPSESFTQALKLHEYRRKPRTLEEKSKVLRGQTIKVTDYSFDPNIFRDYWYSRALGPVGDTSFLEMIAGRPIYQLNSERLDQMCDYYFKTLSWNLSYYLDGRNVVSLTYYYPYHRTPMIIDLAETVPTSTSEEIFEDEYEFNAVHQLLAVLPFESQLLLPPEVKKLMNLESPIYDLFPNQFMIDREGTNRSWEGVVLLPFADGERIVEAVSNITFPKTRRDRFNHQEHVVIEVGGEEAKVYRMQYQQMIEMNKLFPIVRSERETRGRGERGTRGGRGRGERGTRGGRGRGRGEREARGRGGRGSGGRTTQSIKTDDYDPDAWRSSLLL